MLWTKSKIFRALILSFLAGIGAGSFVVFPPWLFLIAGITAAGCAVFAVAQKARLWILICCMAILFSGGMWRFAIYRASVPDVSFLYGSERSFTGVVWEEPDETPLTQRLLVLVREVEEKPVQQFFAHVVLKKIPEFTVGEMLLVRGKLEEENSRKELRAVIVFPQVEKQGISHERAVKRNLVALKNAFGNNLEAALPEPHASLAKGLLLGERATLPREFKENLTRTGTTHIVALSGYNITLVGRSLIWFLLLLTVPFRVSFWIAICAITLFVIMTGASPSVVRAGIMGVLLLVAEREGRLYHMVNALLLAAALMVLHDPTLLRFDLAFQLSFLATLGIIYAAPEIERLLLRFEGQQYGPPKSGLLQTLRKIFIETTGAQLAVLPLLIYTFGTVSFLSPFVNVLVLISVPYAMGASFFTGLLGFFLDGAARVSGFASWVLLEYEIQIIEFFGAIPFVSATVGSWALAPLLPLYGFFVWKLKKRRMAP